MPSTATISSIRSIASRSSIIAITVVVASGRFVMLLDRPAAVSPPRPTPEPRVPPLYRAQEAMLRAFSAEATWEP